MKKSKEHLQRRHDSTIEKLYLDTYSEIMKIRGDAVGKILNKDGYIKVGVNDGPISRIDENFHLIKYLGMNRKLNQKISKDIYSHCLYILSCI